MEKFKKAIFRLLHPNLILAILLVIVSAAGLVAVFLRDLASSPIAYVVYVISFYTILVLAISIPDLIKQGKVAISKNKLGNQLMTDVEFRTEIILLVSLVFNTAYVLFQLGAGVYYASFWYGAVGIYYLVICFVRFMILRNFRKDEHNQEKDLRVYRFCGYFLFVLTVAALGMVIQIVRDGEGARYPGLMVYTMATYAFYRIISSIISVVKYRKLSSPILTASKFLSLATALMAIFSLQTAMIAEFGDDSFGRIITPITGGGVCIIILGIAIYMVIKANKSLKNIRFNKT